MTIYRQNRDKYLIDTPEPQFRTPQESEPVSVVELVEWLSYNCGTAVKHIIQAGTQSRDAQVEELRQAIWHITREITRLENK